MLKNGSARVVHLRDPYALTNCNGVLLVQKVRWFALVWDTDTCAILPQIIEEVITRGCLMLVAVGARSELLHDLFDETYVAITVVGEFRLPVTPLDTRWLRNATVDEAVDEVLNNGFPDVMGFIEVIVVLSDSGRSPDRILKRKKSGPTPKAKPASARRRRRS